MFESTSFFQWVMIGLLVGGGLIAGLILRSQHRELAASVAFGHFYGAAATVALILGMMQDNPESGIVVLAIYPLFTTIGMVTNGVLYKLRSKKN